MRSCYRKENGGILPPEYAECEWIRGEVNNYLLFIDTEYRPNNNTGILLDFSNLNIDDNPDFNFFGCKNNETDNARYMINATLPNIGYGFNAYKVVGIIDFYQRHVVKMNYLNDRKFDVDNGYLSSNITDTLPTMVNNIGIMGSIQYRSPTSVSHYEYNAHLVEITQGNEVVRRFIPCVRLSDMQAGMYELFGNVCSLTNTPFFTKVGGTHNFTYQLKN